MEKREGNNKRGMKYKSGRERSIAVAANFPNFVNKLPGTKILKRIVKVLTCSPCDLSPSSSLPSLIANLSVFYPRENNFPRHDLSLSWSPCCSSFPVWLATHIVETTRRYSPRQHFPEGKTLQENGTRVKIDINTKNICMSQSWASKVLQAAKVFLGAQQQLLVNGFSRRERNTTVNSHPDEGLAQPFHRLPSSFRPIKTAKTSE